MANRSFENLTIVSVTGAASYTQGAIYAIARSCAELAGARGLLISPALPAGVNLPPNITHCEIKPFGYLEYNLFLLYLLKDFIQTDYCLVVQNDGWVINGKNWQDAFWDYDYIGAPTRHYAGWVEKSYQNRQSDTPLAPPLFPVQNGGFSLRSQKLLRLPSELNLPFEVGLPQLNQIAPEVYQMGWQTAAHHEDQFLALFSPVLALEGVRFAPAHTAHAFAVTDFSRFAQTGGNLPPALGGCFEGEVKLTGINQAEVHLFGENASRPIDELATHDPRIQWLLQAGYQLHLVLNKEAK